MNGRLEKRNRIIQKLIVLLRRDLEDLLAFYTVKMRIFDNNSLGSYYKFLVKYEKEYTIRLSEDEEKAIEFISKKLASGFMSWNC